MQTTEQLLSERGKTHGAYHIHAEITQRIKFMMRHGHSKCGWDRLSDSQCEALDMIAHKIGRILAGDPNHQDHWDDIAGYAKLVSIELNRQLNQQQRDARDEAA
jgi:hypothetical protein